jgi:hypothetical protein
MTFIVKKPEYFELLFIHKHAIKQLAKLLNLPELVLRDLLL